MNAQEKKNLQFVLKFWREVVYAGHTEFVPQYMAEDLIQHKPSVPDGRAGFVAYIEKTTKPITPIPSKLPKVPVVMAAKGDYVWLVFEKLEKNPFKEGDTYYSTIMELVRLQNGKIQEQWDSARKAPGAGPITEGKSPKPMNQWNTGTLSKEEENTLQARDRRIQGHAAERSSGDGEDPARRRITCSTTPTSRRGGTAW